MYDWGVSIGLREDLMELEVHADEKLAHCCRRLGGVRVEQTRALRSAPEGPPVCVSIQGICLPTVSTVAPAGPLPGPSWLCLLLAASPLLS